MTLNAVELFVGAGGLSLGLTSAGFNVKIANEIEYDYAETYRKNHLNTTMIQEDIHNIDFIKECDFLNIKSIDLVAGGPPCQGFSTIGAKNIKDPRNSLFFEFLRVVSELCPNWVVFENVAGFQTLYHGEVHKTLLEELDQLGYNTSSNIIDMSEYGLPQKRKRAIIIGWKKNLKKVSIIKADYSHHLPLFCKKKISLIDAISDLPTIENQFPQVNDYLCAPLNKYQEEMRMYSSGLTEHYCSKYGPKMKEILKKIPPNGSVNDLPIHLKPKSCFANTYARLNPNEPSPTITRNFGTPSSSRCVHPYQNRALTMREAARLQSFPDHYSFSGSQTSKHIQIGNAVPPLFGKIIGQSIVNSI